MRLIVGLGNPGPEYVWTPHNLGFLAIDHMAERAGIRVRRPEGRSLVGLGKLAGTEIVLAKPQTFMNASGLAVRHLAGRFDVDLAEMIVVTDDAALPWGTIRVRERGSAGGHNGLKSVIGAIESQEFVRVRLGAGPAPPDGDLAEYVLHAMSDAEMEQAVEMVDSATEAVEWILQKGTQAAMNRFNRRAGGLADGTGARTSGIEGN
ncbi:MAG TPA: aminoacyl-tRNA hydrolase [Candidatus Dormibacteraeota bacterium]|nr:aminoacyl-tRNA hydrolase [Candidatus Dormibacteraeota bacterium]